jgi:tRNA (mo5U34)-methyltransferase
MWQLPKGNSILTSMSEIPQSIAQQLGECAQPCRRRIRKVSEASDTRVIEESRRLAERLSRLGWYHTIELPDGGVIEGLQTLDQQRQRLRQFPIPQDLRGKRVLDVGAWDGWFSFEMERRGADVLAVDSARNTRLLEARQLLGSRIGYQIADICRLTAEDVGTFDIVLFFGVLYHLKHPLLALENVCGMCREMACIESFVTDTDRHVIPLMEFYETNELRGQADNWVGPNLSCLLAFCRTAGFARVNFESVLGERAHVTGYRHWPEPTGVNPAPEVLCVANSARQDHTFDSGDDYLTFYFTSLLDGLNCDNVYPQIGPYGSRPIDVARCGGGWQAACKLPTGLAAGPHEAKIRTCDSAHSVPVRIVIGSARGGLETPVSSALRLIRVADGTTLESGRVRVGENSGMSVWAAGLPADAGRARIRLRLNGTDLPANWLAPANGEEPRQINAALPSGLEPGMVTVSLVFNGEQSAPLTVELVR